MIAHELFIILCVIHDMSIIMFMFQLPAGEYSHIMTALTT